MKTMPCDGCSTPTVWVEHEEDLNRYCGPCAALAQQEYPLFFSDRIGETDGQKRKRLISDFRAIGGAACSQHT